MSPKNTEGKMIEGARRLKDAPNDLLVLLFILMVEILCKRGCFEILNMIYVASNLYTN